jgi:hypothetical protein
MDHLRRLTRTTSDSCKYPRTKRFLEEHPEMTLDDLLSWTEKRLEMIEGENTPI